MQTFVMMTQLDHGSLTNPEGLDKLEHEVKQRIETALGNGGIEWVASYAVGGPYDYMDIFRTEDNDAALKVSTVVRTFGHARSEVWPAAEWSRFKQMTHELPRA